MNTQYIIPRDGKIIIITTMAFIVFNLVGWVLFAESKKEPSEQYLVNVAIWIIDEYQENFSGKIDFVNCRHLTTCSEYCRESFLKDGFIYGLLKSIIRVSSCI